MASCLFFFGAQHFRMLKDNLNLFQKEMVTFYFKLPFRKISRFPSTLPVTIGLELPNKLSKCPLPSSWPISEIFLYGLIAKKSKDYFGFSLSTPHPPPTQSSISYKCLFVFLRFPNFYDFHKMYFYFLSRWWLTSAPLSFFGLRFFFVIPLIPIQLP